MGVLKIVAKAAEATPLEIRKVQEIKAPTDIKKIYVAHGGRDFDIPSELMLGSGEPGGVRPLGKGLYGYAGKTPEEAAKAAIAAGNIYAKEYGGSKPVIHLFEVEAKPGTVDVYGSAGMEGGWGREFIGQGGDPDKKPIAITQLPIDQVEIAIRDLKLLKRLGKFELGATEEEIRTAIESGKIPNWQVKKASPEDMRMLDMLDRSFGKGDPLSEIEQAELDDWMLGVPKVKVKVVNGKSDGNP